MEEIETRIRLGIFRFISDVEVKRLSGFKSGLPIKYQPNRAVSDPTGAAAVHFPIIVQFTHARFRITRTDIGFKTTVYIAAYIFVSPRLAVK